MTKPPVPLTALSEDQRAQAQSRFTIIRPALENGVTQTQVARTHNNPSQLGAALGQALSRAREKLVIGQG